MSGSSSKKTWLPLESNPEVINKYIERLGASGDFEFVDIFGLDQELLQMIPQPVWAILLLYPITPMSEQASAEEQKDIVSRGAQPDLKEVYFTRQTVPNACGTVGILHTVLNLREKVFQLQPDQFFGKFYRQTAEMSPLERAHALEKSQDVEEAHEFAANQGDSRQVEDLNEVDLHFVALVNVNGRIYEMDGRKEFPIDHGSTCPENFLNDAIQVVRKFLERDPNNLQFSLCALAPKQ